MKNKAGLYGIHEVYYNSEGEPNQSTVKSMVEPEESVGELAVALFRYIKALEKPVLDENHKETK